MTGITQWIYAMRRPRMGRRLAALTVSICLMGLGVAVFDLIGFGTDPCSCMNLGISRTLGISFGTWQMSMNAILMLLVLRWDVGKIGIGTVVNMVCVGYIAEFFMRIFDGIPALGTLSLLGRIALFVPMMALFLMAAAVYTVVDMGFAPYDAVPMILAARARRMSFRAVRMCWDVCALTIGYMLGATVGLVTLVTGFCLGPVIAGVGDRIRFLFE